MGTVPRILLVEDDDLDARLVRTFLERGGVRHTLSQVRTVELARNALDNDDFDLVLVDQYVADGLGLDLISTIADGGGPPCILLTGSTARGLDEKALRAGAIDYLDKGELSPDTLRTLIRRALIRYDRREKIRELAFTDGLTGLANRARLLSEIEQSLARARRRKGYFAVLYMDLDGFKPINDTMGHLAGDELLVEVGRRLQGMVRATDTVARMGGDEFVVLLDDISDAEDAVLSAARIRDRLQEPATVQGQQVQVGVSIGVATWPVDGDDAETLIQVADESMYTAKRATSHRRHAPALVRSREGPQLEDELRRVVLDQGFDLCFQPRVDLASGEVTALEARLRWTRQTLPMRAQDIVPALDALGLLSSVDCWVAREAAKVVAAAREDHPRLTLALNLSRSALEDARRVERIGQAFRTLDVPTTCVEVQLDSPATLLSATAPWRELGVRVVGCGRVLDLEAWSELVDEPDLHAIELGLRSVCALRTPTGAAAAAGAIAMARSLGLRVFAAGAEDLATLQHLQALGIDEAQGHIIAPPMPAEAIGGWLGQRRRAA